MPDVETRLTSEPADHDALAPLISWAYGDDVRSSSEWLKRADPGSVRVAGRRGKVEAGLVEVAMGQWFQARRVPLLGIAGVAVAPEARGQGVALALLTATLRAARERGLALGMLYPSTYALYRKLGYELAGSYCRFTLQLRELSRARRSPGAGSAACVKALAADGSSAPDAAAVEALYRQLAAQRDGYLDRGPYVWNRVRAPGREPARCFGVSGSAGLSGYVYARALQHRSPSELALSDFVVKDRAAFDALLAFFADHASTLERVTWTGGAADARLLGLPERRLTVAIPEYWMLRLIHVEQALLARGYPPLDAAVDLEVEDECLPENTRTYPLRVRGGAAELGAPGASGRARISIGALAALYSGFVGPHELVAAGQLAADDATLRALGALFSGHAPACADYF
jgi:predicted acetyltransferase